MEYKYVCEQGRGGGVRKVWNTSMYVNKRGGGRGEKDVEYKYVCEQDGGGGGGGERCGIQVCM